MDKTNNSDFIECVEGSIFAIFWIFLERISVGIIIPPSIIEGININWAKSNVILLFGEHTPNNVPKPKNENNIIRYDTINPK